MIPACSYSDRETARFASDQQSPAEMVPAGGPIPPALPLDPSAPRSAISSSAYAADTMCPSSVPSLLPVLACACSLRECLNDSILQQPFASCKSLCQSFGEPVVDLRQRCRAFCSPALLLPQASEARGGTSSNDFALSSRAVSIACLKQASASSWGWGARVGGRRLWTLDLGLWTVVR